ncbi:crosslink repair DNA glycosylase YcaQ family protein [Streptomyces sp. NPDC012461]|uniref:Winged helix-turn-helix domain-containing protein n=2 Tax=unclassified Streptomyces TaxID=2593676 RepID=A0A6G3R1Y5_9ACTN|nr:MULTISPECIES: crosslink repair DNA glycosylase YcaQ family protein [unclassified Streptomyces]NEA89440.1 winged helix-turn-helix domain-containing protein [Streptomyces sp. SID14436]NEC81662.1 winged helix-turn-helix domain-containing protein [Streptomyces sp. SID7958]
MLTTDKLSADEARACALHAQGLLDADGPNTVEGVLRRIGAVQLDTIAVLARSHELVPYARLGAIGRKTVEDAYWSTDGVRAFEYWAHAACLLPIEAWPYFSFRRKAERAKREAKPRASAEAVDRVRTMLHAGPISAADLGASRVAGGWSSPSEAKSAAETLYWTGEAACVTRSGWKRVYHLTEHVIPPDLLATRPSDEDCHIHLVRTAVRAMGVATTRDIAGYFRQRLADVSAALHTAPDLTQVEVEGWSDPAWTTADGLEAAHTHGATPSRVVLLSPFDPLVWDRERTRRIFGLALQLEAYKPKEQRVNGYFTMPVLAGGRLVGSLDPSREGTTLAAGHLRLLDTSARDFAEQALHEAAAWVGAGTVRIEPT